MEKEVKKVKLSTFITAIIILLFIIVVILVYFNTTKIENSQTPLSGEQKNVGLNIANSNIADSTANNIKTNNGQLNENTTMNQNNAQINTNIENDNLVKNEKYDLQLAKGTIELNGKKHTYEVMYSSNMEFSREESNFYYADARLYFDNKAIRSISLRFDANKKFMGKVQAINIYEQAVIYIDNETKQCEFFILDENAEVMETWSTFYGTDFIINGEKVNIYEINENKIIWYDYNNIQDKYNAEIAVVKYQVEIDKHANISFNVLETYKASEVEMAGKS